MTRRTERTYAEIDCSVLLSNLRHFKELNPDKKLIAVCKANAYGLGKIANVLSLEADMLAVATAEEGVALRKQGVVLPILLFGYLPLSQVELAARHHLTVSLYNSEQSLRLDRVLRQKNKILQAHIALNTGMNRLGFSKKKDLIPLLSLRNLFVNGLYSHYAVCRKDDPVFFQQQTQKFLEYHSFCAQLGFHFDYVHIANTLASDGTAVGNAIRPGYGLYNFRPVLRWKARVAQVFPVQKGETIGYDRTFVAQTPMTVATVSAGYADGYPRDPMRTLRVTYRGRALPVIGRVCMDFLTIDCSGTPLQAGEYVTLLGGEDPTIVPDELGFGYEILCGISPRVKRIYLNEVIP